MDIPVETKDKVLGLLDKLGLPTDLSDKVKEFLSKGWEIEVTKVEVSPKDWEEDKKWLTPDDVEKMSPEEAKVAFKKHLENCKMKNDKEEIDEWEAKPSIEDKLRKIMY